MVLSIQNQAQTAIGNALGIRFDVSPAWKFYVEVLGILVAEFQECSGLGMERDMQEWREGGTNDFVWLLPKHIKYPHVTLKKGVTYNRELWRWFRWGQFDGQVWGFSTIPGASSAISLLRAAGIIVPMGTSVSIVLGTVEGKVAKHWDLMGAIPIKWTAPDMKADSNEAAIETLEIAYQGIDLSLEMGTPMAGLFGGSDSDDLSSTAPHEGAPNAYYTLTTGGTPEDQTSDNYWGMQSEDGSTTHKWSANDFVKIIPTPPNDPIVFDTPDKIEGPNFWDMPSLAENDDDGSNSKDKQEGSNFWDMPNLDPSQPPPKGQKPFAYFDFYDMTETESPLGAQGSSGPTL